MEHMEHCPGVKNAPLAGAMKKTGVGVILTTLHGRRIGTEALV
jgi:hypothetical protein